MGRLRRVVHESGLIAYRSPRFEELGVRHVFTTKVGARGRELCVRQPDQESRRVLLELLGEERSAALRFARQVHGSTVLECAPGEDPRDQPADALTARTPAPAIGVYTADCVPILIASADGSHVAAVHAGWKGILAGVIPAALARLRETAPKSKWVAAIGACLSTERCEMGEEVSERFLAADLAAAVSREAGRRDRVDVRAAVQLQLEREGLQAIDVSDRCTWDDAEEFGSHRRDVTHGPRERATSQGALIVATGP